MTTRFNNKFHQIQSKTKVPVSNDFIVYVFESKLIWLML